MINHCVLPYKPKYERNYERNVDMKLSEKDPHSYEHNFKLKNNWPASNMNVHHSSISQSNA